jgi:hypothetical protein
MQEATREGVRARRAETLYRVLIFAVPAALFSALVWLFASGKNTLYVEALSYLGFSPYAFPFLDLHAILAAADCHRLGIDVYLSNPCDVRGRPHVYSPLWLDLIPGFLSRDSVNQVGIVLDLMFIASLPLIMRPRSAWQCLLFIAATLSTTVIYALERANNDIVIFLLMVCAGALLAGPKRQRLAGYLIFLFAGLLKFYPLALLVLMVRESWRRACAVVAISAVAMLGLWWVHGRELTLVLRHLPQTSYFADSMSARNLPLGLMQLLPPMTPTFADWLAAVIFLILFAYSAMLVLKIFGALERHLIALEGWTRETAYLLIGAILLTGCFLTGENISYRGVLLLLVIPGLLQFRRNAAVTGMRRLFGTGLTAVLGLLWEQCVGFALKHAFVTSATPDVPIWALAVTEIYWLGRELLWWGTISLFVALIIALFLRMPLVADLALLLPKRNPSQATGVGVRRSK